ncbi:hypothetical protein [Methylobacterium frigidaeris]|uniref:Uncharacterized protein n=1 Tax=Methylobacterium frigidaeris TaxID=2038277 RepID=A0AA37M8D2_9HYPH|nr:hypothetical protein [Methylobacterium frigidaeris]GJD65771.1 hypothetical protein MPEAHAMD_5966 [Methylobacterium frigidaeris]
MTARVCRVPRARCERYVAEGLTAAQIGRLEGWTETTILKHLRGLGIAPASRARVTLDDVLSVIEGRETVRDVCGRLGVTRAAVHVCAARAGIRIGPCRPQWGLQLDMFRSAA